HQGSQLIVAQSGIDDLLFAQSTFPQDVMARVADIPGVAGVYPVVGVNGVISVGRTRLPVYLVGFDAARRGGPWRIDSGSGQPRGSEVVLDRGFAHVAGVRVGDHLTVFGRRLRVAGTSAGTDAAGDFFLFVPLDLAQS